MLHSGMESQILGECSLRCAPVQFSGSILEQTALLQQWQRTSVHPQNLPCSNPSGRDVHRRPLPRKSLNVVSETERLSMTRRSPTCRGCRRRIQFPTELLNGLATETDGHWTTSNSLHTNHRLTSQRLNSARLQVKKLH